MQLLPMPTLLRSWSRLVLALLLAVAVGFGGPAAAQEWTAAPAVEEVDVRPPPAPLEGWETVYGAFLRVHGPADAYPTLLRLARHGSEALPRLAEELGVPIGDTIHVYVAATDVEFRELQPGRPPGWADATAYPSRGIIFLRLPKARGGTAKPLEQVFDHELVHILLGRAFAPQRPPQWLQEGVAQVMAGEHGPETTRDIARGMLGGGLLTLEQLSGRFPGDPMRARLAYAQSADFVSWMMATYGEESLSVLIHEIARGEPIGAAVRAATGELLDEVDGAWRARFDQGVPLSLTPLVEMDALLGLAGLLLIVGGVLRRRQFHRRLEEMEAEERLIDELLAQAAARGGLRPDPSWCDGGECPH